MSYCTNDFPDQVDRRRGGAGCCAVTVVLGMAGILGLLLLAVWIVAPAIAERFA